jgi:hypothetical protein
MSLKSPARILGVAILLIACVSTVNAQSQRTRSPHGTLDIACQNCHVSEAWKPVRAVLEFNHNSQTRYPLMGAHKKVACATCHVTPVFREAGESCSSCHADIHRRQFGASCDGCHTVQGWRINLESIRYHANRFPLAGAHSAATCESCHRGAASATFVGLRLCTIDRPPFRRLQQSLRELPCDESLVQSRLSVAVQSHSQYSLSTDGSPCLDILYPMPHKQSLCRDSAGLRVLPHRNV